MALSAIPAAHRAIRAGKPNRLTMLLAAHESRGEILGYQSKIYAADGGTRPTLRGCSVSPALSCISFRRPPMRLTSGAPAALVIGRKAAQERFSEESFRTSLHFFQLHRKRISQQLYRRFPHNFAHNQRHTASLDELAELINYSKRLETSSTHLFASHGRIRSDPAKCTSPAFDG